MSRRGPRRKSSDALPALPRNGLRVVPLGGLGEIGRNMTVFEHAGPAAHRRLRGALPRGAPAGRRRDPPRLHLDPGPPRQGRRDRAHPRPRGPHRRRAVPAARAARHPRRRLAADPGLPRGQAQGAPHHAAHRRGRRGRPAHASARSTASSSPSTTPSPTGSPSPSAPRPGWCCTPATSRWTSSRSTAGSPTCGRSPGSARRASTCSSSTPPTPRCPGSPISEERARARDRHGLPHRPAAGSSCRASPATCTASSRSSTPPSEHGRKVAFVGRSMVRNMGIARDLGYLNIPEGLVVDLKALEQLPADQITLICTGSQGEPMAALSRMANRDHLIEHRRGRHRAAGQLADPGQRERHLPGHQRAHPLGRQRRAQGQRQGARLRPRQRRRARLLLQHRPARRT